MAAADAGGWSSAPNRHGRLGVPSNLPAELSSFVGRRDDIARAVELLAGTRLLTLTGVGGCGKTRLSRQAALAAGARFPHGVWWVELAALTDGELAADALARVLDLPLDGAAAVDVLVGHLSDATAVVVLDNCEHVVDAVAGFVDRLLRGTGRLRVMATSREPLRVEGETVWRVPSLAVPPASVDWSGLGEFDASRLFLDRLGQVQPGAAPGADRAGVVAQICRSLDGIPLALELAAAQARTMTLDRVAAQLDDRFRLLTGGPRQALARHQTLLASVEWSYDLLDEDERLLLRRLTVFVGGFPAEGAEAVAGTPPLSAPGVRDLLGRLVDCSLVQFDDASGRYRLLETIREYGRRAGTTDDRQALADRHLDWVRGVAEELDPAMTRADLPALDAMEAELPNLRVALDHAATGPTPDQAGLRLVVALTFFWAQRGLGLEGAERAVRVLEAHPDAPGGLRARAWAAAAYDRFYGGEFDRAAADADHGLAEAASSGDVRGRARCRHVHGAIAFLLDPPDCRVAMSEAIALARVCGDRWCETDALQFLAFSHLIQHRQAPAQEPMMQSAAMAEAENNAFQLACHHVGLGMTAAIAGRLAEAVEQFRAGADGAQRIGDPVIELWGRAGEANAAIEHRSFAELDRIAADVVRPGRPLSPVMEAFVAGLRRLARTHGEPVPDAVDALLETAELLRTTFVPNAGMRLTLIGAACASALGDDRRARAVAETALGHAQAFGSALTGPARVLLGRLHRRSGDPGTAERLAQNGLSEILDADLLADLPDALEVLAGTALDTGSTAEAARLLGAASALRAGADLPGAYPTDAERDRALLADALGADFAERWAEGEHLDAAAAVAYARRARGARKRPAWGWEALTPTELQVARLAAAGLSNAAIGQRLFVARATVKTHLEHVYVKLGLHSRAELAGAAARRFGIGGVDPLLVRTP